MGNRIEGGQCIKCGFDLLDLSDYFCTQCRKEITKEIQGKVAARKSRKGKVKRIKTNIGMLGVTQKLKGK